MIRIDSAAKPCARRPLYSGYNRNAVSFYESGMTAMTPDNSNPPENQDIALPVLHRYISCEACGKRMLVDIEAGAHAHCCPVCGVSFVTDYTEAGLSVRFDARP